MSNVSKHKVKHRRGLSPYLREIYSTLFEQVGRVLQCSKDEQPLTVGYNKLYKYVEFICRDRQQSPLATQLFEATDSSINSLVTQVLLGEGDELLKNFVTLYDWLYLRLDILERIFLYLDRTYLLNHPLKKTIKENGFYTLYTSLTISGKWDDLYNSFEQILCRVRRGEISDMSLELEFFTRYHTLAKWDTLDKRLLESSRAYFTEAHDYVVSNIPPENRFEINYRASLKELDMWKACRMNDEFLDAMHRVLWDYLILYKYEDDLCEIAKSMFQTNKIKLLHKLWNELILKNTLDQREYLQLFLQGFADFVSWSVNNVVDESAMSELLQPLINLKSDISETVSHFKSPNKILVYKARDSFQSAISNGKTLCKLSKSIDNFFRSAELSLETKKASLEDILLLFKSIQDKEYFLKMWKGDLSKRLIQRTTPSLELEDSMLQMLGNEVNEDIIKPMRTMVHDMTESHDLELGYQTSSQLLTTSCEFHPLVLNSYSWPVIKGTAALPPDLNSLILDFQQFYLDKWSEDKKHKLQWCPAMSSMVIEAHFPHGDKQLHTSEFQGLVLLLFNDHDSLSFEDIKALVRMDSGTLSGVLYSLTNGKHRILTKDDNAYSMNKDFSDKRKVIKLRQVQMRLRGGDAVEEDDESPGVSNEDRNELIRAFITRLMKHKESYPLEDLINAVLEKYIIQRQDVETLIRDLIQKDYLERGLDNYIKYKP